ncbi:MAG: beta-lactamase family protein [Bacteroidetes bacterium]|nr:beta-lactamase family protein [Bacteroidota bacterium]
MALANRQAPGAALAVLKDTSIIFLKGYGLREFGQPDSIDARTVFRIGSVSKSVTATLCTVLVNEGVIHWDDPVMEYLPDFKLKSEDATRKLTLRHLLSHTEGLPYHAYTDMVDKSAPVDTLIDYLQDLDLIAEPGQIYSYQNVGFSLIGKVIEAATKKTFEEVLTEKLFRPLHMVDASASFQKIAKNKNSAKPHQLTQPLKISEAYYSVAPAGGVNASAQDMALWLKELLTQKANVLTKERLTEIFEPQVQATVRNLNFFKWKRLRKSFYGLGWRVISFADGDTLLYHGGLVNNYRCEVAVNLKTKTAVALLVNSPGLLANQGVPQFFKIYDRYLDSIRRWKPAL